MENKLKEMLHSYLVNNRPDLLVTLQSERRVTVYLDEKLAASKPLLLDLMQTQHPEYIIEEVMMEDLTADLRPSKYSLLVEILRNEFEPIYNQWREIGILTTEIIGILEAAEPVFQQIPYLDEDGDNDQLYTALTGTIAIYLDK